MMELIIHPLYARAYPRGPKAVQIRYRDINAMQPFYALDLFGFGTA